MHLPKTTQTGEATLAMLHRTRTFSGLGGGGGELIPSVLTSNIVLETYVENSDGILALGPGPLDELHKHGF